MAERSPSSHSALHSVLPGRWFRSSELLADQAVLETPEQTANWYWQVMSSVSLDSRWPCGRRTNQQAARCLHSSKNITQLSTAHDHHDRALNSNCRTPNPARQVATSNGMVCSTIGLSWLSVDSGWPSHPCRAECVRKAADTFADEVVLPFVDAFRPQHGRRLRPSEGVAAGAHEIRGWA